jgi:hypothetical protein
MYTLDTLTERTCQMGTEPLYPQRMSRSPWVPNPTQEVLLATLRAAAEERKRCDERYRELLAECALAEIPIARIATEVSVERKTIYRHLGRPMK